MKRREFITLLGGAAAWPLTARAQQGERVPVIGFLSHASPDLYSDRLRNFRQGLKETGYVEGQNVSIEYRWAEGHNDRLPTLAAQLVQLQVSVIAAAGGTPSALAAKAATALIPVVFGVGVDPVEVGLVASLNRPGGNLTGVTNLNAGVGPKRIELLHELLPKVILVGVLVDPTNPTLTEAFLRDLQPAAHTLGLQLVVLHASTEGDLDTVFGTLAEQRVGALIIGPGPFFAGRGEHLGLLTVRHAVPTIFQYRPFAAAGGLMSYGTDEAEYYRLVGIYAARILKGEKPTDLPVQQATKVELEEATGAPSSFAVWDPRRLRASGRDGGWAVTTQPLSALTMLLSRHTSAPGASWCDPAGESPAQVRSSVRLVASVAWSTATLAAKRTQRLHGVWD